MHKKQNTSTRNRKHKLALYGLDCAGLSQLEWGISVMKQQSSCPVELRGELLKAESLRDGQHVSQVIRRRGD